MPASEILRLSSCYERSFADLTTKLDCRLATLMRLGTSVKLSCLCNAILLVMQINGQFSLDGFWSFLKALAPVGCLTLLINVTPALASEKPDIGPPADWVKPTPVDLQVGEEKNQSKGVEYLLVDRQVHLAPSGKPSRYTHFALRAANANGLEQVAHVEMAFDPAYQRLKIHQVNVIRLGRRLNKLKFSDLKILHREPELERQMLDGRLSVNLLLEDVRVGDVVDYAYTIEGNNPIFGNAHFGRHDFQWGVPVRQLRERLIWPESVALQVENVNGVTAGVGSRANGFEERAWELDEVTPLTIESEAPAWYDPYPAIYWSTFQNWSEVVEWALGLYKVPDHLGEELIQVIQKVAQNHKSQEERVAAVLKLVQSEVRYLGVEVGVNSHLPNPPDLVYKRRYGDCKDKALLMIAMLHELGIEAYPALVNTGVLRGIAQDVPSPGSFDHVIVKVPLGSANYWLDPTRAKQEGTLATLYQPDYGLALVLSPGNRALEKLGAPEARVNTRAIRMEIDASDGFDKPATVKITYVANGRAAESMRTFLASKSRPMIQKDYLNYYVGIYPGTTVDGEMEVTDDPVINQLTTIEKYRVPAFWIQQEGEQYKGTVYSGELKDFIPKVGDRIRKAPLSLNYPLSVTQVTDIKLPTDWEPAPSKLSTKTEQFEYVSQVSWPTHRNVEITESFRTKSDHVPAAQIAEHVKHTDNVRDSLGLTLTNIEKKSASAHMNWPVLMIVGMMLLGLSWLATRLYRYDPSPQQVSLATPSGPTPSGIGGWLILPTIGMIYGPGRAALHLWDYVPSLSLGVWNKLTTPGAESYDPMWAPVLLYELLVNLSSLVLGLLLLVLLFRRRTSLPKLFVWISLTLVSSFLLDIVLTNQLSTTSIAKGEMEKSIKEVVRSIVVTLIWSTYFLRSKRVANTFTKRLTASVPNSVSAGTQTEASGSAGQQVA